MPRSLLAPVVMGFNRSHSGSRCGVRSRMSVRACTALTTALAFLLCSGLTLARAHALLLRSDPGQDAVLKHPPTEVRLWFSEDLNASASKIVVWDRYRHDETAGPPHVVAGNPREMTVDLKHLAPGSYLVLWTSVSAQDGHLLRGSFLFSVGHRGPGPSLAGVATGSGEGFPDAPTTVSILIHCLELFAAVAWAGTVFFSAFAVTGAADRIDDAPLLREFSRTRQVALLLLLLLVLASCGVLVTEAYQLGGGWAGAFNRTTIADLFADQYGELWIGRQVLVVVALLFFIAGRNPSRRTRREWVGMQSTIAVVYLYAFAASGHAASANVGVLPGQHGRLFSLAIAIDWLHYLADAAWLGGQIAVIAVLLPALRDRLRQTLEVLDRFSPLAFTSVAVLTLSGGFNGVIHIPSWYAYFHSVYGWTLTVKIVLIGLMILTSGYTVFLLRPEIKRALSPEMDLEHGEMPVLGSKLSRWLHVNPILGAGVLLATSVMFYYPVPVGLAPAGPGTYTARAAGLTASLSITPDRSGPNTITIRVRKANGTPVREAHITVLTRMLDMEMGQGLASLTERKPGTFSGSTDLGMGGHWALQILIFRPPGVLTRMTIKVQVGS